MKKYMFLFALLLAAAGGLQARTNIYDLRSFYVRDMPLYLTAPDKAIALSIFVVLKLINNVKSRLEKAEPEVPAAPAAPSAEEKLLSEILEQLKKNGAAK